MRRTKSRLGISAAALVLAAGAASAETYYLRDAAGDAWGGQGNDIAMNIAFGQGNWIEAAYQNINVGDVFDNGTDCVYIDGGDGNATNFKNFMAANAGAIENWVSAGGSIFINAAGWYESQINVGFQNTIINGLVYDPVFNTDPNGPIAQGPAQPAGPSYTGNYASHGFISGGPGFNTLGTNGAGQPSLVDFQWGAGRVLVGALTDANLWWNPDPNGDNARANMLTYMCRIPSPGAGALFGIGSLVAFRRRR